MPGALNAGCATFVHAQGTSYAACLQAAGLRGRAVPCSGQPPPAPPAGARHAVRAASPSLGACPCCSVQLPLPLASLFPAPSPQTLEHIPARCLSLAAARWRTGAPRAWTSSSMRAWPRLVADCMWLPGHAGRGACSGSGGAALTRFALMHSRAPGIAVAGEAGAQHRQHRLGSSHTGTCNAGLAECWRAHVQRSFPGTSANHAASCSLPQAVYQDPDSGLLHGVSDPRKDGAPAASAS